MKTLGQITLAIDLLPPRLSRLGTGGIHWLAVDKQADAQVLALQFLEGLPSEQAVSLIYLEGSDEGRLPAFVRAGAEGAVTLFRLSSKNGYKGLERLPRELERARVLGRALLFLMPADLLRHVPDVAAWALALNRVLMRAETPMLMLCHGRGGTFPDTLAGQLSGLARLESGDDSYHYHIDGWRNDQGLQAGHSLELILHEGRFGVAPDRTLNPDSVITGEQRLIQKEALLGMPLPSRRWLAQAMSEAFWQQALGAQTGFVVVAVSNNAEVGELARQIHHLRAARGAGLVIVVREMQTCLRQMEQEVLLQSGTNLIVPAGTSHAALLCLLNSLQGQLWHRPRMEHPDTLMHQLRPPRVRGLQSPQQFLHLVDGILQSSAGKVRHQLLKLPLRPGLTLEQCWGQIHLRREGDLACLMDNTCYLFLFGCRDDGLEAALDNICRLPWGDLFSQCQILSGSDALPRRAFEHAEVAPVVETDDIDGGCGKPPVTTPRTLFTPVPIRLPCKEIHPS
ncbi:BcsE family c-di-GMP-binding protein [Marinobacterium marinum]|uniref:Cellulose biosynthesis protein BcsE n=1 Tax=Marinobacterium marinum TaxID=2756129 RepID=A0A7W1WV90_9GAMM|nr:BcsE family c-di-GMP-binding protein [Marinobacterium marinum]MBA4500839.1 hypothetical protein [Marinobacterium marinum]